MNKHTKRIGSLKPHLTGVATTIYQAFLAAMPEYRSRVVSLAFSYTQPDEEIGTEVYENVFFNSDSGAVFVLVPLSVPPLEKDELAAGQAGPQGVIR